MKTIYLLIVIGLISSCGPASYIPTMPNVPMHTKQWDAQAKAGLALDHVEVQAAVAVLPFLGLTGGKYYGFRNVNQIEYGANLFAPLNRRKNLFLSFAFGEGVGSNNGTYTHMGMAVTQAYSINNKFSTFYLRPSLYYVFNDGKEGEYKLGLAFKHREVSFSRFDIRFNSYSGMGAMEFEIKETAKSPYGIIHTPFICLDYKPNNSRFFLHFQAGYNIVTKSFKTTFISRFGGWGGDNELRDLKHPYFQKYMANVIVGFKIN